MKKTALKLILLVALFGVASLGIGCDVFSPAIDPDEAL